MRRRDFLARTTGCPAGICAIGRASAQAADRFDLVIRGGTLIDPANGMQARADIGIRGARIAALEPEIDRTRAVRVLDAHAQLVTPGLIDMHTHVYPPRGGGSVAEQSAPSTGVTTWVSAGDASIHELADFRRFAARHARCRVYGFVHLGVPHASTATTPESSSISPDALGQRLSQHRDLVLGVALRPAAARMALGPAQALEQAIAVLARAQTRGRVLCNVPGSGPWIDKLRPGDVLTHVYRRARDARAGAGTLDPALRAARDRGVILDVGYGTEGFDVETARAAIAEGLFPDVISSAAAPGGRGPQSARSLAEVMSRFLNLGLSLEQVLAMTTINPARLIGREPKLGTLELGAPADISLLQLVDAAVTFTESHGERWQGTRSLRVVHAVRAGMPIS